MAMALPRSRKSRSRPVPLACLLVLLSLSAVPCQGEGSSAAKGSIRGTVTIGEALQSERLRFRLYPSLNPNPPRVSTVRSGEIESVVIFLASTPPTTTTVPLDPVHRVIEQRGEAFMPQVLPVVAGSTVEFPNTDRIFHNVFSLSKARSFDLGRYPQGSSRSVRFDEPGIVKVFCHLHADMSAIVIVRDNPFFDMPDSEGRYAIHDVPPGDYKVVGWHGRARLVEHSVRVAAGQTVQIDFSIPISADDGRN